MLRDRISKAKGGGLISALALAHDEQAAPLLLEVLHAARSDEDRGYLCLALGLLGSREARASIVLAMKRSSHRPDFLFRAVFVLALLPEDSDEHLTRLLQQVLEPLSTFGQTKTALVIGLLGDGAALEPLLSMRSNHELPPDTRAIAAAAIGAVDDDRLTPWNAPITQDLVDGATTHALHGTFEAPGIPNLLHCRCGGLAVTIVLRAKRRLRH